MIDRVYILFDEQDPAYPIIGVFTSLDKAKEAAGIDVDASRFCVYEELVDDAGEVTEPTRHQLGTD